MMRHWWLGTLGVSLTLASAAVAEETGVEVGLRSGYAIPLGSIDDNSKLSDGVSGIIPLWFDLGYRITPNVMVGAYFQYGFGLNADACTDCSIHNMRLGGQVHYHFLPWEDVDPWIGAGLGYEWLGISRSQTITIGGVTQTLEGSSSVHGFEFVNLQGGVDFLPSEDTNFGLGPFVSLSFAKYSNLSVESNGEELSGDVDNAKIHEWLTLGVRGTFVP